MGETTLEIARADDRTSSEKTANAELRAEARAEDHSTGWRGLRLNAGSRLGVLIGAGLIAATLLLTLFIRSDDGALDYTDLTPAPTAAPTGEPVWPRGFTAQAAALRSSAAGVDQLASAAPVARLDQPEPRIAEGDAIDAFAAELERRHISGVSLVQRGEAVEAWGVLPDATLPRWREAAVWYEDQYGFAAPLIDEVGPISGSELVRAISIVSRSPKTGLFMKSGSFVGVGERAFRAWRLDDVTADGVVLADGERVLRIELD